MLVQRSAIETTQCPVILGKVSRHPIEDHSDPGLVELVDQEPQVVGFTETTRG